MMKRNIQIMLCIMAIMLIISGCTQKNDGTAKENKRAMNVKMGSVEVSNFSMNYCKFGTGKKILVILPGLSVQSVMPSADNIAEAYKELTDDYTVYVFDRRDGVLPDKYEIQEMASDTAKVIQKLGLKNISLFGASQGGMIAIEMTVRYPELVDKLIIGSSSSCISEDQFRIFEGWIALAKAGRSTDLYLAMGEALYPKEVFDASKDIFVETAKTVTDKELERFVILTTSLKKFNIIDDLAKIICPVFVIGSNDDRVLGGAASEEIAKKMKNSKCCDIYMYDGYGHAVYDLAPDYQKRMLKFLKRDE